MKVTLWRVYQHVRPLGQFAGIHPEQVLTFLKNGNMEFQSHRVWMEPSPLLATVAQASMSWREGRSKNMPLMALLPPTTLPAKTKAIALFASGIGCDWTTK